MSSSRSLDDLKAPDYEADFVGWAIEQARRLRSMSSQLSTLGLDAEHLAEEVEDLARRDLRELQGLIRQSLVRLIKAAVDPNAQARRRWESEVAGFVIQVRQAWSPGYQQRIDLDAIWKDAIEEARNALAAYDVALPGMPDGCPLGLDAFITRGFDAKAAVRIVQEAFRGPAGSEEPS